MTERHLVVLAGAGALADEAIVALQLTNERVTIVPLPPRSTGAGTDRARAGLPDPAALIAGFLAAGVTQATMVGRVDFPAAARNRLAAGTGSAGLGDLGLMGAVARLFQRAGIALVGIHEVVPDFLAAEGLIAGPDPDFGLGDLSRRAILAARTVGSLELGQGVVIGNGRAVAAEDAGGTDALLRRVADLRRSGLAGGADEVLVLGKALKPGQPLFVDLPTIGPETVRLAADAGLAAIVVEAGRSLVVGRPELSRLAEKFGITVVACQVDG
jgi:DUF1009 family protein